MFTILAGEGSWNISPTRVSRANVRVPLIVEGSWNISPTLPSSLFSPQISYTWTRD
ncbi:MAG TPA: hypothetical protein PLE91_03705 [Methanothermobacter sp.]|nr:hypothetical protein [Methanothermobacter sp.]